MLRRRVTWQGFSRRSVVDSDENHEKEIFGVEEEDMNANLRRSNKDGLLKFIERDVIGRDAVFDGPFGPRNILYCDYVASGKGLNSVETFMMKHVLPTYANTHTHSTVTSAQTTAFREEAKEIIRQAVGANDDDVVIFAGNGVTGVIHKLIAILDLAVPPVVFCGPFEHHSNLLPWREMDSLVINISETADGKVNLRHLEIALKTWSKSGRPLIGTFSAASNVTGITTDTRKVAALLHKYDAISLWDYATAGPYVDIKMHPKPLDKCDTSKDAIFISMHKFVGSPDAPGLLVASKKLFRNPVPSLCGGGTVLYVSENDHRYLKDVESREEGGTPAIIGSIRAGIAFKLKMSVGGDVIMSRENALYQKAMDVWSDIPELEILGALDKVDAAKNKEHKIAVFSFLIRHRESGYYLHYNFVTALLNDLFGIQSRGGCACAGVYAQHLLGIDRDAEKRFGDVLVDKKILASPSRHETERTEFEILRPGFTRLNFPYFISDDDADYIISAVGMIAKNGWTLLPLYQFHPKDGSWTHKKFIQELEEKRLEDITFQFDGMHFTVNAKHNTAGISPPSRVDCLKKAERVFFNATAMVGKDIEDQRTSFSDPHVQDLRWFLLPFEAQSMLKGIMIETKSKLIFETRRKIHQLTDEEIAISVSPSVSLDNNDKMTQNGSVEKKSNVSRKSKEKTPGKKSKVGFKSLRQTIFCKNKSSVDVSSKDSF